MLGDSNWLRAGAGLLTAVMVLGSTACGGDDQPKKNDGAEQPSEESDAKGKDEEEKDDSTIGDGPNVVGSNVRGIPEGDNYIADNGFRPAKHGFLFPNGDRDEQGRRLQFPVNSPGHLDKDGMQRLFGSEKVCLGLEEHGDECLLTPGAHEFMNMVNRKMNGGQCEGLAVFSLSLFSGRDPVDAFEEGAALASDLEQDLIRGPVGYYFSYQFLQPFRGYLFGNMEKTTPNEVLQTVITSLKQKDDPVALEFFQPRVGGHAVVPYAVEDKGNGIFHVRIWDNNFPKASRYIEFDKNKNSWLYSFAAINPSEDARPWGGNASMNTIVATPVSKRMGVDGQDAVCPFCERETGIRMLMTSGGVNALIHDSQGRKIGMENGKLVNEIPGAAAHPVMSFIPGEDPPEPLYELPANEDYDIELVGKGSGQGTVGVFGTDSAMVVEDINMNKGERDRLNIPKDGKGLDYTPGTEGRKPKVRLAMGSGKDSYRIELNDLKPKKGSKLGFRLNRQSQRLNVTDGGKSTDNFRFRVTRFTRAGQEHSVADGDKDVSRPTGGGLDFGKITAKLPPRKPRPRIVDPKGKKRPRGLLHTRSRPAQKPVPAPNKPKPNTPVLRKPLAPAPNRPPAPKPAPKRPIIRR